jgi:hypothetical protein
MKAFRYCVLTAIFFGVSCPFVGQRANNGRGVQPLYEWCTGTIQGQNVVTPVVYTSLYGDTASLAGSFAAQNKNLRNANCLSSSSQAQAQSAQSAYQKSKSARVVPFPH